MAKKHKQLAGYSVTSAFSRGDVIYLLMHSPIPWKMVAMRTTPDFNDIKILKIGVGLWTDFQTDGTYVFLTPYYGAQIARFDLKTFDKLKFLNQRKLDPRFCGPDMLYSRFSPGKPTSPGWDKAHGFIGGFNDGTYGYLPPYGNAWTGRTGRKLVRFNMKTFGDMKVLDLGSFGSEAGWGGGFSDGKYGYVFPLSHSRIARFDLATFSNVKYLKVQGKAFWHFMDDKHAYIQLYGSIQRL